MSHEFEVFNRAICLMIICGNSNLTCKKAKPLFLYEHVRKIWEYDGNS